MKQKKVQLLHVPRDRDDRRHLTKSGSKQPADDNRTRSKLTAKATKATMPALAGLTLGGNAR